MALTQLAAEVGTHMPFPREEYERRWAALEQEGSDPRLGYDTAVIWGRSGGSYDRAGHITYLTETLHRTPPGRSGPPAAQLSAARSPRCCSGAARSPSCTSPSP